MERVDYNSARSKNYNSIDLVKFFMAFCVIAIHTKPLASFSGTFLYRIYWEFIYISVPFFFLASGFLMARNFDDNFSSRHNQEIVRRSVKHIALFYITWTILYMPLTIYHYVSEGTSLVASLYDFVIGLVMIGEHYNSWQLWYLLSTIYALLFILLMMKVRAGRKTLFAVGAVIMLLSTLITLLTDYKGDLPDVLAALRNLCAFTGLNGRVLRGLYFIPAGVCLQRVRLRKPLCAILYLGGFMLSLFFQSEAIHYLIEAAEAIGVFGLVLSVDLKDSVIYPMLRKMSTGIYFIHMYVWTAYYTIIYHTPTNSVDAFVVTAIVSVVLSFAFYELRAMQHRSLRMGHLHKIVTGSSIASTMHGFSQSTDDPHGSS